MDLSKIVIVDDTVANFGFHLENGVPIIPFCNNINDNELKMLINYLDYLSDFSDIRRENTKNMKLPYFLVKMKKDDPDFNINLIGNQYNSSGDTVKSKESNNAYKTAEEQVNKDSFGDKLVEQKLSFNDEEYFDFAEEVDSDDESIKKKFLEVFTNLKKKFTND